MEDELWPPVNPTKATSRPMCFSVHGAYHAMVRRLQTAMRDIGVGPSDAFVLISLSHNPLSPPADLRLALGLHRSTLLSILDRLERRGMIVRSRSTFDGRRFELRLTNSGQRAADQASVVVDDLEEELRLFISPQQRGAAAEAFGSMVAVSRPDRPLDV
jgi:DNA-binding MarR family transcriptional regulator